MASIRKRPVMEDTPKSKKDDNFNLPLESDVDVKKRGLRWCSGLCVCLVPLSVIMTVAVITYIGSISDDDALGYFGDNTKDVYNRKVAEEIKNTAGEDGKQPNFPTTFERESVHRAGDNLKQVDINAVVDQGEVNVGVVEDDGGHVEMKQHMNEVPGTREQEPLPKEHGQAVHGEDQKTELEHEHIESQGPLQTPHVPEPHPGPERSPNLAPSSDELADPKYPQPPSPAQEIRAPAFHEPQPPAPVRKAQAADVPSQDTDQQDTLPAQSPVLDGASRGGLSDQPGEPIEQNPAAGSEPVNVENIVTDDASMHVGEQAHAAGEM